MIEQARDSKVADFSAANTEDSGGPAQEKNRRETSTIQFPYINLEDSESGARALFKRAGTAEIGMAQAAAALDNSVTSSTFRTTLAAMKMFGLVTTDDGRVRLTPLGRAISETPTAEAARVDAFQRIPLYARIKENHNGRTLPKSGALEQELIGLGVATKQAPKARQVFERSARFARFLVAGSDRFVEPIVAGQSYTTPHQTPEREEPTKGERRTNENPINATQTQSAEELHPFIRGLLKTLPPTDSEWPASARVKWLRTAAGIFDLMYQGEAAIRIENEL